MKILIANRFFFRNGGSEAVLFQERDFLLRTGHEVVDFSMHDERDADSYHSSYFVGRQDCRGVGVLLETDEALARHFEVAICRVVE